MNKRTQLRIGLVIITLGGMAALRLATRWGAGVGGDATIYIESARNLLEGNGLGLVGPQGEFRLLPYFPPFFSLVLAVLGFAGADLMRSAQWINILSFGGLIYLIGNSTLRDGSRARFAYFAAFLVAASPVLIPVYSWAMSEPLSLLLGFGAFAVLAAWLEKPEARIRLFLSALAAGLSFLTRYSSVAFLMAGGAAVYLLAAKIGRRRILDTGHYFLIGVLPMGAWLIYDFWLTSTVASRSILSSAGTASRLASFWPLLGDAVLFWLVPDSWITSPRYPSGLNLMAVAGFLLILSVGCGIVSWKISGQNGGWQKNRHTYLLALLALFILAYVLTIFLVYIITYPPITIGSRMLSPVHIAVLWLGALLAAVSSELWAGKRWLRIGLTAGWVVACLWYGGRTERIVAQYYETGLGYTSPAWQNSQTMVAVRHLPPDILLISNEINAIQFLSGRPAYPIKEIFQDSPSESFAAYGNGDPQDDTQKLFREGRAVLVLFDTIDDQLSGLYGERTDERISALVGGLRRATRGDNGGLFYYQGPND
jgi:hypothetical protein